MPLTVSDACVLIREGHKFGDVAPLLSEDAARNKLREWYVRAAGVPVNPTKRAPAAKAPATPLPSGDLCQRCGGIMVRTGTCSTCSSCGDSSGGCG